jgi:hypothetical protein
VKKRSSVLAFITITIAFANSPPIFAAGNHDHGPKFGGVVAEGKAFDAELVAKPDLITIHVGDHGKPMATKGAKGKITLLTGAEKTEATLLPAGDSRMEAKGKFNVASGTKAVVEITLEGKKPSTVRFAIK